MPAMQAYRLHQAVDVPTVNARCTSAEKGQPQGLAFPVCSLAYFSNTTAGTYGTDNVRTVAALLPLITKPL